MGGIAYFKVDSNDPEAKTGFGYYIIIDHGGDLYTIYAHLQKHENWQPRRVNLGDIIGKVDNSGNSTGPHLHFEVREGSDKGKYAVNPGDFLDPEHISNYISSRGAISRIRVSTFIDGNELDGSFKTIPQGIVRNISYDSIWDLAQTQAMAGDHTITVRVFDGAFGGVGGTAIGDTNVNVKVEPPKIWNEKPTGEITEKRPTISAIITSPSNIPIKVSSIIITLNGIEITSTFSPNENAPEIQISYTPISDLSSGTHTVTVNGSDVNENAASFSWNFNEDRSAGKYTVDWFGDNQNSEKVASGVYLYVLKTAKEIAVQKIMVIR